MVKHFGLSLLVGIIFLAPLSYAQTPSPSPSPSSSSSSGSCTNLTAPTNVKATSGNAQVVLSWNAVTGASKYQVFKKKSTDANFTMVLATSPSFTDSNLTNGITYNYQVAAVNNCSTVGAKSVVISATPTAPKVGDANGDGTIDVSDALHLSSLLKKDPTPADGVLTVADINVLNTPTKIIDLNTSNANKTPCNGVDGISIQDVTTILNKAVINPTKTLPETLKYDAKIVGPTPCK